MRRAWILLLLVAGCQTSPTPEGWHRYGLGVPMACAEPKEGVVYLRHDLKSQRDGNSYSIQMFAMTNSNSTATDSADVIAANADLATNRIPRRVHLDLSIDGGTNWIRRIGYGVQTDGIFTDFSWSPPQDYSLMTEHARIRAVRLDGSSIETRHEKPYDHPAAYDLMCQEFVIAGIVCDYPAGGEILYNNTSYNVTWHQTGGQGVVNVYWITPDTVDQWGQHLIGTCSNAVAGTNSATCVMTCPPVPQARMVIRSVSDPDLIGYSKPFEVD